MNEQTPHESDAAAAPQRWRGLRTRARARALKSWARSKAWAKGVNWARGHKVAFRVLETVAGVAVVLAVAVGLFFWQLSRQDISMSFLTAPIERAVNGHLADYTVSIGDTVLEKSDTGAGISLRLKNVQLWDGAGAKVAEAPKAAIGVQFMPLLTGNVVPASVDLIGPRLAVTYTPDGRISVALDKPAGAANEDGAAGAGMQLPEGGSDMNALTALMDDDGGQFGGISEIGIRDATATFVHQRLGRTWDVSNGDFLLKRDGGALKLFVSAQVANAGRPIAMSGEAEIRPTDEGIEFFGTLNDFVPRVVAEGLESLGAFSALDLPVKAAFSGSIDQDGTLKTGTLNARLGAGHIRTGDGEADKVLLDEGTVRLAYDAETRVITVDPAEFMSGRTQLRVTGKIEGRPLDNALDDGAQAPVASDMWHYELEARDALLGSADVREEPFPVERITLTGNYDLASGDVKLVHGELLAKEASLAIQGYLKPAKDRAPELMLSGRFLPMSIKALKGIWPSVAAPGARRWVADNVRSGEITGGSFDVHFPAGMLDTIAGGGSIPPEALKLEFQFADLATSYLEEMPYIRGASGTGTISGDRFTLAVAAGRVDLASGGTLTIPRGSFTIPRIADAIPQGVIEMTVAGDVGGVIELLNNEPLGYPSTVGVGRDDFSGKADVNFRLDLPLIEDVALEDVKITGEAEASKFAGAQAFAGHDISDGVLVFRIKDEVLTAEGEVLVGDRPAAIEWRRPFEATADDPSTMQVAMTLDAKGREEFGLSFPYVSGPVRFTFEPEQGLGEDGDGDTTIIIADLKDATVAPTPFGWSKAAGKRAEVRFTAVPASDGTTALENFTLDADGADVRGNVLLTKDGTIQSARFPQFALTPGDKLALSADRTSADALKVTIKGGQFDASSLIGGLVQLNDSDSGSSSSELGDRLTIDASIDRLVGQNGVILAGADVSIVTISGVVTNLDISGSLNGNAATRVLIEPAGDTGMRALEIRSDDAGAAFAYSGMYPRAEGGRLSMRANLPSDPNGTVTGILNATDFRIAGEQVLSTINQAATRDDRRGQPLGNSTHFDRLRMPFERRPGEFRIGESVLRGPAVGATISGTIDYANSRMALNGTFIPAYALNNLLARVPIVGEVLMGGREEGLLGVNFAIRGTTSDPQVLINPLSIATPGIFRKIFDIGQQPQYAGPDRPGASTGSIPGGQAAPIAPAGRTN